MSRLRKRLQRGALWYGRRWSLTWHQRTPARRAGSWCGIGPAREDDPKAPRATVHIPAGAWSSAPSDALVLLDVPPGNPRPGGRLVGFAVHAGPCMVVVTWQRVGIRGLVERRPA